MRFLDELVRDGVELASNTLVINADNVARYFYEQVSVGELGKVFPNVAPPFEYLAIEWHNPPFCWERQQKIPLPPFRWVIFSNNYNANDPGIQELIGQYHLGSSARNAKWISVLIGLVDGLRLEQPGTINPHMVFCAATAINPDGQFSNMEVPFSGFVNPALPRQYGSEENPAILNVLWPYFLTLSFMHCKNVTLENQAEKAGFSPRRHLRLFGRPPICYKVLAIEPMQKIIAHCAAERGVSLLKALHICRGHFKDYSRHDGLFGKYKGIFWWNQAVRGNIGAGAVVKSYKVLADRSVR